MAYTIFAPGTGTGVRILPAGKCRIGFGGHINLSCHDLVAMQVKDELIVEVDTELKRIAFRPPKDDSESPMAFTPMWNKCRTSARVTLRSGLMIMGIDPKAVRGTHDLIANGRRRELVFGIDRTPAAESAEQPVTRRRGRPRTK